MLITLTVEEVMSSPVETVSVGTSTADAARKLKSANVGSLVVCDGDHPVGIVTESDVVEVVARNLDAQALPVEEIISGELVSITPETDLETAARTLAEHDIRRLPVCEEGHLVGIVTTTDLSYFLPHLARSSSDWADRIQRTESSLPEMSYDDPEWVFERVGSGSLSVGDAVRFRKELSETDVERFAEATGDTNRIHLEEAFAEATQFGGRIVHGTLTAGVISAALARLPGLTVYLSQDLRFLGPVRLGETVTAVCEVVEALGTDKFELTTTVYGEDGEVVADGEAVVLMRELPEEADDRLAVQSRAAGSECGE